METFWFSAVTFILAVYVVLDGYDFGVGIAYPFAARTDEERRTILTAIGPVWSGNEVWLIVAGTGLFLAFPRAYAAGFSGLDAVSTRQPRGFAGVVVACKYLGFDVSPLFPFGFGLSY